MPTPKTAAYESNLWKLNATRVFFSMHFFGPVLVPFFTQWGGLTLSQVFFLNSWFFFCNFLFEVPTGAAADHLGRKTSLVLGSLLGGFAAFLYTSHPALGVFLVAEAIFALAYTFYSGADEALAYDSLKAVGMENSSKKVLARMGSFRLGGILFGSLTGGFIAAKFGLPSTLRATGIAIFISLLFVLLIREPKSRKPRTRVPYLKVLKDGVRFFMGHRVLWILTLEAALVNALVWAIIWLYQPFLEQSGLPLRYYGVVQALSIVGQIWVLSNVEKLEKLFGSKRGLLTGGGIVTGLAFLVLGWAKPLFVVIPAIILAFTFGLSRMPLFSSYMNKYIPSGMRATVLSTSSMVRTFGITATNLVVGVGLAYWSIRTTAFLIGLSLIALSVFSRIEEGQLKD